MKRWPLHKVHFWETMPFFRLLVPLVAGICLYPFGFPLINSLFSIITIVACTGVLYCAVAFQKRNKEWHHVAGFIGMQLCIFFMAWLICYNSDVRNNPHWIGNSINSAEGHVVRITSIPKEKEK